MECHTWDSNFQNSARCILYRYSLLPRYNRLIFRVPLTSLYRDLLMDRTLHILDRIIAVSLICFVLFSMFSISLTQISGGIGGIAWLTKTHLTRSWGELKLPLGIPILLFVLACILAVITAVDPGNSYKSLKKLLQLLIFFWVINNVKDEKQQNLLVLLLVAGGCVASLTGVYQAWIQGITVNERVEGTLSTYMTFAGLLMLTGMFTFGRFVFREKREFWLLLPFTLMSVCLLLTLTRQAWLGYMAGLLFLIFCWRKIFVVIIPVLIVIVMIFPPEPVRDRFQSMLDLQDENLQIRLALWRGGWEIFKDHPVTGCGFKCVDVVHSQYPDPKGYVAKYKGLHNNFIQVLVDTGVLGFGAWLSIWIGYFLALFKIVARQRTYPWIPMASAASVIAFLAGGFFEVNFYDAEVVMLLYFIMALPFTFAASRSDGDRRLVA